MSGPWENYAAAAPATPPGPWMKYGQETPTYRDAWGTPSDEIEKFLANNPTYQFLGQDAKFPNRRPGIYPMGPGNEWRNDPDLNARKGNVDQWPVDLHLLKNSYEGAKTGAMAATAPLAFEGTVPQVVGGIVGGTAGSVAASKGAKAVGIGDTGQEVAGDVGALLGGGLGVRAGEFGADAITALRQTRLAEAAQNVLGLGKDELISKIPVVGRMVRRPSFSDYVEAIRDPFKKAPQPAPVYPGAPQPTASAEQLNPSLVSPARTTPGQVPLEFIRPEPPTDLPIPGVNAPISLHRIAPSRGLLLPGEVAPSSIAGSIAESVAEPKTLASLSGETPSGAGIPRTLSGESILNQVLGGRDQSTLLKIARSRGINVTQEAQLKPGVANKRIIGKIIDDFSPEELDEIRAQGIENARFRHAFGDIGDEAWNTMALQTYFPDVKIPVAQVLRTQKAIQTAAAPKFAPTTDLAAQLKTSPSASSPAAKPPGSAGSMEDSLNQMLKAVKKGKTLKDLAAQ